jgi:Glyoxalase-like domain
MVFVPVPEGKQVKNRLHIDLAPWAGDDHAAEVARLERLGATRVDVARATSRGWCSPTRRATSSACCPPRDTPELPPA